MEYKPTIGLEIHAELRTKTKMFCSCKNDPNEKQPNINICPVCMGHPGTLPVINKEAVKNVLKVGIAVGGNLALDFTEFDRKNYFYPDIPKGYQISQYKYPLVSGGNLAGVSITRIHLEEDTARSSHDVKNEDTESSFVDFNRAGVPLMELVTEPVIHSAQEVVKFGQELQLLLQYLGVSDANMEKGEMRLEANISVSKTEKFGTKVEVKNLNSFKSAEKAIEFEIKRQTKILEDGGNIIQETRGWDDKKQLTFSQRSKEDSHDYRYFPDPDLPKLRLKDVAGFDLDSLKSEINETPNEKRSRFNDFYNLKITDIEFYINNVTLADFFENTSKFLINKNDFQLLSNYIVTDIASLGGIGKIKCESLAKIIEMINSGELSSRGAKNIIQIMFEEGGDPVLIAQKHGLVQKNNEADLLEIVKKIVSENEKVVAEYKSGKTSAIQFLVGQGMKATGGSANPAVLKGLILKVI